MPKLDLRLPKQTARLENWYVYDSDRVVGDVYGHPRFPDGHHIITSTIDKMSEAESVCETLNTIYTLGAKFKRILK